MTLLAPGVSPVLARALFMESKTPHTLVLACLRMCELASFLRTRPPVDEEGEEVRCADVPATIKVGGAALLSDLPCLV